MEKVGRGHAGPVFGQGEELAHGALAPFRRIGQHAQGYRGVWWQFRLSQHGLEQAGHMNEDEALVATSAGDMPVFHDAGDSLGRDAVDHGLQLASAEPGDRAFGSLSRWGQADPCLSHI